MIAQAERRALMTGRYEWELSVLRGLTRAHPTDMGAIHGFLMTDAESAFGGLSDASAVVMALMAGNLVHCVPFFSGGNVSALFQLSEGK
jgi:hypothetical protein